MAKNDKNKGGGFSLVFFLIVLLGVGYFLSPYWTVIKLEKAMREGNTKYLNDHINFKKMRKSIKNEIKTFSKDIMSSSNNRFVNLAGSLFSGAIVDNAIAQIEPVLNETVSAEGLVSMAKNDNSSSKTTKEDKYAVFTSKGVNYMNLLKAGKFNAYNEFEYFIKCENEEGDGESEICSFICRFKNFKWVYTDMKFKDNWENYFKKEFNLDIKNSNDKDSDNKKSNNNDEDDD